MPGTRRGRQHAFLTVTRRDTQASAELSREGLSDSEQSEGMESFILASFQFPLEITNDLKSEL